jgi:uncharacterized repeat protein (TIGR03803 family)
MDTLIQGLDGNFYATSYAGGMGHGTIFKMTPTGTVTSVHAFSGGADGDTPVGGVIQGIDGNLYGTTALGGGSNLGVVFKMTLP